MGGRHECMEETGMRSFFVKSQRISRSCLCEMKDVSFTLPSWQVLGLEDGRMINMKQVSNMAKYEIKELRSNQ